MNVIRAIAALGAVAAAMASTSLTIGSWLTFSVRPSDFGATPPSDVAFVSKGARLWMITRFGSYRAPVAIAAVLVIAAVAVAVLLLQ